MWNASTWASASRCRIVKGICRSPVRCSTRRPGGPVCGRATGFLKIDDTSTDGLSIDEAIKLMSGDVDTEVSVTILHADESEPETVKLKREHIQPADRHRLRRDAQGEWDYVCDAEHQIAYVRITAFSNSTAQELRRTLTQLLQRGHAEGWLSTCDSIPVGCSTRRSKSAICSCTRVASSASRGAARRSRRGMRKTEGTLMPRGFPVAVLVNRFSASAAEIVSACLQDNHAATGRR